ncbi:MAG: ABC transporter substrate-binding protein [Muribaculaceae bacterium]|nr:ABC transporter substrate-binding protein [Muribaculaceae bacterium]
MKPFIFSFALLSVLAGCGSGGHVDETSAGGDTITSYASALVMVDYPDYVTADVSVPWQDGYLARYVVPKHPGAGVPDGRIIIRPEEAGGIVSFSSVYSAALSELGILDRLQAVADPAYLADGDTVKAMVAEGRVADAGSSMAPLLEVILDSEPQLVFASPYETGGAVSAMRQAGLPVVLMADYVETDPRGRAEWMRLIGLLTGRSAEADSIARSSIARYNDLARLAQTSADRPKVITEKPMQGIWYVPGGRSYVARLIADAAGNYVWESDSSAASIPMGIENVLERGADANIWLIKEAGPLSREALESQVKHAGAFAAMPDGVWTCNTLTTDYFNDVALHPDRILEDYLMIFHPELAGDSLRLRYYTPLK